MRLKGNIRYENGQPFKAGCIRVFDKDMRSEELLGETKTDSQGNYEISYNPEQFSKSEKDSADLVLKAYNEKGLELAASPILFNAGPEAVIDLVIKKEVKQVPSEYELLCEDIKPVSEGVPPAELTEKDVDFLVGETGQPSSHITILKAAHDLKGQTDVPAEAFYGFFREDLPTDLRGLLANSLEVLRKALENALHDNIIPAKIKNEIDEILERLLALQVKQDSFLVKPEIMYEKIGKLKNLTSKDEKLINGKLNDHLRQEILNRFVNASENMNNAVKKAVDTVDYRNVKDANISDIINDHILTKIKESPELSEEAESFKENLAEQPQVKVTNVLNLDLPLQKNPIFHNEIHMAKTVEYAQLAGLDDQIMPKILEKNLFLDGSDDHALNELVKAGVLTDKQRENFQLKIEQGRLTGHNIEFVSALGDKKLVSFVSWENDDWLQMITEKGITTPPGETTETYAEKIQYNIEISYPAQFLLNRLANPKKVAKLSNLNSLNNFLNHVDKLIEGTNPVSIEKIEIKPEQRKILQKDLEDLTSFANTYRQLGIVDIINDKELNLEDKKDAITTRLQPLETFYQNNPNVDLRLVDFFAQDKGGLNWNDIPESEQPMIKNQLMAYQRVLNITGDVTDRQMLLSRGYDSVMGIAFQTESKFINNSGLPLVKARMIFSQSQKNALRVSHTFGTIRDVLRGNFKDIAVSNIDPELINDLRELDSIDDLFGPQDYCDCDDCKSILSPAAYFVDLMYFIEEHVSNPAFVDSKKEKHPLYLKNRRSDLWTLPLTCENTNVLIPYLNIVNEVLETYLKNVLNNDDVYKILSQKSENRSFNLPFNLPLEEIRLYLSHFELTLFDIYHKLKQPEKEIWRTKLSLSQEEFNIIITPKPGEVLSRFGNPPSLDDFPVNNCKNELGEDQRGFINLAGITRKQLDELLDVKFNNDLKNIIITEVPDPDNPQNYTEILENLTLNIVDVIHRFIRLWRKTSWSIPDLDLVLTAIKGDNTKSLELNENAVLILAQLIDIQEKFNLTVEELCPMAYHLPVSKEFPFPAKQSDKRLYERLFDLKKLFGEDNLNTHKLEASISFHHYSLNKLDENDAEIDEKTPLLLSGLGISETELLLLFNLLKNEMDFNDSGDANLDLEKISLLYRHARLAKALKLNIEDFIELLNLIFKPDELVVKTLPHIHQLREFTNWLNVSPFTISELNSILRDNESTDLEYLFEKLIFEPGTVEFIADNPKIFGITDAKNLTVDNLKSLTFYKKSISLLEDAEPLVQTILTDYSASRSFNKNDMAKLWQQDESIIDSLNLPTSITAAPIEVLENFGERLELCETLGINGYSLQKIIDGTINSDENPDYYEKLIQTREVALGAFSSKYDDEKVRNEKLEPYHDKINMIKRDGLCDYIIARQQELKFKDLNDIYSFFLLDNEMSGCFRTSRIVAAISSLQLYVHRILTNLEQSDSDNLIVLNELMSELLNENETLDSFKQEWEWRKNYRVWEANRKVFLYPENYLEPDLRDNKTPIFKELEDELLQEKITKESAESAYKKYLSQFSELARLRIAGSYYNSYSDTYYFFGYTPQDPPQYHYRKWIKNTEWTPWEKIELGITSNRVSAIIYYGKLYLFWADIEIKDNVSIETGSSKSKGLDHTLYLYFSYLNEKGKWLPPQKFEFINATFSNENEFTNICFPNIFNPYTHPQIIEYENIYLNYYEPEFLKEAYQHDVDNLWAKLDLFHNDLQVIHPTPEFDLGEGNFIASGRSLLKLCKSSKSTFIGLFQNPGIGEAMLDKGLFDSCTSSSLITSDIHDEIEPEMQVVGSKPIESILKLGDQQYLVKHEYDFQGQVVLELGSSIRRMIRLSTSLTDHLGQKIFSEGLESFLALKTQEMPENYIGINIIDKLQLSPPNDNPNHINFSGAHGIYYEELFFHIPYLIANHLNANQKFKEAKWWYERVFDPTASEQPITIDRNWQYINFRNQTIQKMKDILEDDAAIEQYEKDPFSPHAIARLRLNAYQKAIVMKYIDNLLDWGDYLFSLDTRESINEATMLYILAADILGERPVKLGKCKIAAEEELIYDKISSHIESSTFLIELENWIESNRNDLKDILDSLNDDDESELYKIKLKDRVIDYDEIDRLKKEKKELLESASKTRGERYHATEQIKQSKIAFCVPPNNDLLRYWDRVADRLYKIRNCMNISGVRRQLALFQPPIEPMALVRAKAAGLSLEDILVMLAAPQPPYRFNYLIEKAKQFTQTVQSFGSALLSALEKKDVEELTLLRSVHERNILRMTKGIKKQQVKEAQHQYLALVETKGNVQNRIDYYQGLVEAGLTDYEVTQQVSKHIGTGYKIEESIWHFAANVAYLIPQTGSPFAMTYGGEQLGKSLSAIAGISNSLFSIADSISTSAGLESTFQRREQEWNQQLLLAQQELKQVEQQQLAAEIRQSIAEKDLEIHEKNMEQSDELHKFYKDKFTNLGLYNYLSITLTRLYREAYNIAHDMAKMAEKAYQFERDEDETIFIAGDNWQYDRAGLLAGERLLLQLQRMEKTYLEQNTRDYEVNQSFSLALLDPSELIKLRETGTCEFKIPEIIFDMFYPGQYRRLIKSVRLSIPCVTGPYTNISAKLTLQNSYVRKKDNLSTSPLETTTEPLRIAQGTSITTSSAQNDAGMFEFNFRDERYLPFEGAGAVSSWKLELPSTIRLFDYDTISDAIIHISYTAKDEGAFKEVVENEMIKQINGLAGQGELYKLFSLRHDFPDTFHKLLNPDPNKPETEFEITKQHFPYFLTNRILNLTKMTIFLKPKDKKAINTGLTLHVNKSSVSGWEEWDIPPKTNLFKVELSPKDSPIKKWTINAGSQGLNKEEIEDIILLMQYKTQ